MIFRRKVMGSEEAASACVDAFSSPVSKYKCSCGKMNLLD